MKIQIPAVATLVLVSTISAQSSIAQNGQSNQSQYQSMPGIWPQQNSSGKFFSPQQQKPLLFQQNSASKQGGSLRLSSPQFQSSPRNFSPFSQPKFNNQNNSNPPGTTVRHFSPNAMSAATTEPAPSTLSQQMHHDYAAAIQRLNRGEIKVDRTQWANGNGLMGTRSAAPVGQTNSRTVVPLFPDANTKRAILLRQINGNH